MYNYRKYIRNIELLGFEGDFPLISSYFDINDFKTVKCNDYHKYDSDSLIEMFIEDYMLERYWNNPLKYIEMLTKCKYVLTPDFSMYIGMPKVWQMWNVFRNRFIGYIWARNGISVIPTICWSDKSSFDYCFAGVKEGSNVAVSNIGCRTDSNKKYFDVGFDRMKEVINPKMIIFQCNKKYKSYYTDNNIIFIDSFNDERRKKWAEDQDNQ